MKKVMHGKLNDYCKIFLEKKIKRFLTLVKLKIYEHQKSVDKVAK